MVAARKVDGMGLTLTIALLLAAFLIVAAALIAAFGDVTAKPRRHGEGISPPIGKTPPRAPFWWV